MGQLLTNCDWRLVADRRSIRTVRQRFIYPVKHLEKRTEFSSSSTSAKGFEARANGARAGENGAGANA